MRPVSRALLVVLITVLSTPAFAVQKTWVGGSNFWNTGGAWSGGTAPATTDSVLFNSSSTYTVSFDSSLPDRTVTEMSVTAGNVRLDTFSPPARTLNLFNVSFNNGLTVGDGSVAATLNISSNIGVTISTGFNGTAVAAGGTLNIGNNALGQGGTLTTGYLELARSGTGTATLNVDGASAVLNFSAGEDSTFSNWGDSGNIVNASFSNGSTTNWNVNDLSLVPRFAAANTVATATVQSGAAWINLGYLNIGESGNSGCSGTLTVTGGGSVAQNLNSGFYVGANAGSGLSGFLTVTNNGQFNAGLDLSTIFPRGRVLADGGTIILNGPTIVSGQLIREATTGSVLDVANALTVKQGGLASFRGSDGASLNNVTVDGAGSLLETPAGTLTMVFNKQLTVTNGGTVTAATGLSRSGNSAVSISGASSSVNIGAGGSLVDTGGGTFNITSGAALNVGAGGTTNFTGTHLNIDGGFVQLQSLTSLGSSSAFNFAAGSLGFIGGLKVNSSGLNVIAADNTTATLLTNATMDASKTVNLVGTTTIDPFGTLTISGGTLNTSALVNNGTLAFTSGKLGITGAGGFGIGSGTPLGNAPVLGNNQTLSVTSNFSVPVGATLSLDDGSLINAGSTSNQGSIVVRGTGAQFTGGAIANTGILRGDGTIAAPVNNNTNGEIRGELTKTLTFTATPGASAGKINLQGGTVQFATPLTNGSGGLITGRGTLITGGTGLNNLGNVALSSGITDVFGDVVNVTGNAAKGIQVSGNADVTFWDDVTNTSGLFRVSGGSSATFFGTYAGGGISGTGNIYFEGDITPGFSPANDTFEGSVDFGPGSRLVMELGGAVLGSGYDHLNVFGNAALGGDLNVVLLYGFQPITGETFDLFDLTFGSGLFNSVTLPYGASNWDTSSLYSNGQITFIGVSVPEPSSLVLMFVGLAGGACRFRHIGLRANDKVMVTALLSSSNADTRSQKMSWAD